MSLPHSKTKEDSRKCLDDLMTERLDSAWLSVVHAIQSVETGDLLGLCGIAVLHESEQGEIWYLVRPDHWGRGIAQKAARELLRVGFLEMNLHRMFATCLPENPASARVLDKIGMRKECHQLKTLKIHGVWQDCFLYAILRDEWEAGIQQR
jgi:RimJ/RimL family protein N-acetyltransferase